MLGKLNPSPTRRALLTEWLLWALPAYFSLVILVSLHYVLSMDNDKRHVLVNEQSIVGLIDEVLGETLVRMSADAKNLAYVTRETLETGDDPFETLTAYFLQVSSNNDSYDQIRFLDNKGLEKLRVNNENSTVSVVPSQQLQNKSHRYYWQHSIRLNEGSVYISPMDLNVEGGEVQLPLNPTIRVGTPVLLSNGAKAGVILLNYKANQLINKLLTVAPEFTHHLYIYNPQGIAIIHPGDTKGSPFNVDAKEGIPKDVFQRMQQNQGQYLIDGNYYTYSRIQTPINGNWTIVSVFPEARFSLSRQYFYREYTPYYLALFVIVTMMTLVFSRYRVQTRWFTQQQSYEKQFRQTLENIQLAAVTINEHGIITFCNDFFLGMVGYQSDDIIGKKWITTFIPKELQQQAEEALKDALRLQTHQPHSESVVLSKAGDIHLVSWTSTFTESHKNDVSLTLLGEDVTERKMTQEHLQRLSHAIENSQNSVLITDLDSRIVYVNPIFCEVTGYERSEVLGRTPGFLQSGETHREEYEQLWQTLEEGKEWRGEFHNKKKSGELFWERARISPVKDVEGRSLYYVAVKQDITEEKRLAEEVAKQTQERINHEKLAAVGKVVNMIAHDLRNPLSSIKMVLQIQARSQENEMFDISLEQVRYMEAILEDLLTYSRPDQFKPEWIDLNKLLESLIASQEKMCQKAQVTIRSALQPNLPTVYADPIKLRQAMQNLLVNAIQAAQSDTETGALVSISTNVIFAETSTQILIEIFNSGPAIDPCLSTKVFEPFFTTKAKGTGLGLAIVKRIIDAHQGAVQLVPTSKGTVAKVSVPTIPDTMKETISAERT
ncbi:PAS domain S-box protein [Enterovibrio sp. ZSDZ35]|uniref:histidine kinase n=1 Tax=Enterovibrio qingdaonensis TaxID=2899818 RepID=A0ABT5QNZ0_9GAMM|nr:PAS domain S-box protein [Enterovibrio sp. ZSDZ35]MDD1782672.1 PAS domain S-box protein [Enterovibrio sp. ZSDZ35]